MYCTLPAYISEWNLNTLHLHVAGAPSVSHSLSQRESERAISIQFGRSLHSSKTITPTQTHLSKVTLAESVLPSICPHRLQVLQRTYNVLSTSRADCGLPKSVPECAYVVVMDQRD